MPGQPGGAPSPLLPPNPMQPPNLAQLGQILADQVLAPWKVWQNAQRQSALIHAWSNPYSVYPTSFGGPHDYEHVPQLPPQWWQGYGIQAPSPGMKWPAGGWTYGGPDGFSQNTPLGHGKVDPSRWPELQGWGKWKGPVPTSALPMMIHNMLQMPITLPPLGHKKAP